MTTAEQDRLDKLRLIRSAKIGPISYKQLLRRYGSAGAALEALPDLARRGGGSAPRLATEADIRSEFARVADLGSRHIFLEEKDYPPLLAHLDAAPPVLIARGHLDLLRLPSVALVGARNASAAACRFARGLAADLADKGVIIVSGLARGIDTHAHLGAGEERTIGVIASGIDLSYPPENTELQARIGSSGLVLTEHPPGREPLARHFPARNRIIAGLCHGTVVVEAALKSGSLITARLAAEAGRDVMAVPGSPMDPRAQGCNQLIREGAILVQNADDIIEQIQIFDKRYSDIVERFEDPIVDDEPEDFARQNLIGLLSPTAVAVDELVRQSGLSVSTVQVLLLELDLAGRIERHAGGRVSLS